MQVVVLAERVKRYDQSKQVRCPRSRSVLRGDRIAEDRAKQPPNECPSGSCHA